MSVELGIGLIELSLWIGLSIDNARHAVLARVSGLVQLRNGDKIKELDIWYPKTCACGNAVTQPFISSIHLDKSRKNGKNVN